MSLSGDSQVSAVLQAAQAGDRQAAADLLPLVYAELHQLARARLARQAPGQTLQPTALVHEDGGRCVSASSDRTVRLWDTATGQCLRVFEGHTDVVFTAVFHPDGKRIASAGRDRAVWLWDPESDQEVARLPGHTSYIWSLAFSPDGKTLVSGSGDTSVRLWDTEPLRVRYQARRAAEALRPAAERLVEGLFRARKNAAEVAAAVRADQTLSEPQKHAALRVVLRRSAMRVEAGPPGH
jgi:hypothetical protein